MDSLRVRLQRLFLHPPVGWLSGLLILACSLNLYVRYPANPHSNNPEGVPTDFAVYVRAWERVSHGQNPYVASDPSPYKYAPGILPLLSLPPHRSAEETRSAAWFAFGTLSIVALALSLVFGARYRSWKDLGALTLGLCLAWKGILETMDYGQLELLILGIAVLAVATSRRTPSLSGVLAGTLPWFKAPWTLLALPLVIILAPQKERKLPKFLAGYLGAAFLWGAAVPSLMYGPDRALKLSESWVRLLETQPLSLYFSDINQSAWVSAIRWWTERDLSHSVSAVPHHALFISFGLVCAFAGFILGRLIRRTSEQSLSPQFYALAIASPWMLFTQLMNPLAWRWGSVFAVGVPFASFCAESHSETQPLKQGQWNRRALFYWTLAGVLLLLQQNPVVHWLGYKHWTQLHHYGLITLYWMVLLVLSG